MDYKIIPYKRYWYELGNEIPLDENSLLVDPETEFSDIYFEKEVYTTKSLTKKDCLLLLGEPGIGKSNELEYLHSAELHKESKTVSFDLRNFDDKRDLKDSVLTDTTVSEWIHENKEALHIYFDGLDEALLEARTISIGVLDLLRDLKNQGKIILRITCRTSDLPADFESQLAALFEENSFLTVELLPLRNEDIKFTAREYGVDEMGFYHAILEKELGVLASRPITLNMLINEYLEEGKISESLEGIYENGCLYLLDDSENRKEMKKTGDLTPNQRMLVAERIAAVLMLCNKSGLNEGLLKEVSKTEIHIDELDSGKEYNSSRSDEVSVSKKAIEEVLSKFLFKPVRRDSFTFIHQTFAEFLTARYLVRNQLTMPQIKSILFHEDGNSKGVVPQLKEVAVWLSLMHHEFYMALIEVDPVLLLKSNISVHDPYKLNLLTKTLIHAVGERRIDPFYRRYFKLYKYLEYDHIDKLLKKELSKSLVNSHSKMFMLDVIDAIGLETMAGDVLKIILDEKEDLEVREYALNVLAGLSTLTNREEIIPVLSVDDSNLNSFKAKAVKCLFPQIISSNKVIELFSKNTKQRGEILKYSGYHLLEHSNNAQLIDFLDWAANNIPERDLPDYDGFYFWEEIILAAIEKTDDEGILRSLSRLIFNKIQIRYSLFASLRSERSYQKFLELLESRRKIIEEIVSIFTDEEELALNLRRYHQSMVVDEDFDWVLNHILGSNSKREGCVWSEILRCLFRADNVEQINMILLNKDNESIKETFKHWLAPVDIYSEEAKKAREIYQEMLDNSIENQDVRIPPEALIKRRLKELRDGNVYAFVYLDIALSLMPVYQYYEKQFDFDIEQYPGWVDSDEKTKNEIVDHAIIFIKKAKPAESNWLNDITSSSAYRAFKLIRKYRPEFYMNIPDEIWQKWSKPFVYFETNNLIKGSEGFLNVLFQKFCQEVVDIVIEFIKLENQNHDGSIYVTNYSDPILSEQLENSLFQLLEEGELKPRGNEIIKEKLLEINYDRSLEYIKQNLDRKNVEIYVVDAYLLAKHAPNDFYQIFWGEFEKNSDLSHKIVAKLVFSDRHQHKILQGLNEEELAKMYIWLEKNYPAKNYPRTEGMTTVTSEMQIRDFRRYTLDQLVKRGTEESCNQMLHVITVLPNRTWLNLKHETAKEIYRRENWAPVPVDHLLKLANDKNTRFIKNEHDLLQITIEKLDELQKKLQDQEQSEAIVYWNEDPVIKPKDENFMSDRVKSYLTEELLNKGVILNREVEIQKGNKTDIHITAMTPDHKKYNTLKLVIEVKGCWHKDLKTAFKDQLINKYLRGKGIRTGVYLVGWFMSAKWNNEEDYRFGQTPKYSLDEVMKFFIGQQKELKKEHPNLLICSRVLDFSI